MEYFHVGIFVIPGVCLIRKEGSRNTALFLYFSTSRGAVYLIIADESDDKDHLSVTVVEIRKSLRNGA